MTTHYEVLRPVVQADLDANPTLAEVLRIIPPLGHVTFEAFRHVKNWRAVRGVKHARYKSSFRIKGEETPYNPTRFQK